DQLRVDVRNINISDEPPLSTSIASTLLGISAEAEPAQVNEDCSFEQIFWRHRQCPAAGICACEQRGNAMRHGPDVQTHHECRRSCIAWKHRTKRFSSVAKHQECGVGALAQCGGAI